MKTISTNQNPSDNELQNKQQSSSWRTKDPMLRKVIAYLRMHHHLDTAFLVSKQTQSTENQIHFPPTNTTLTRQFTYTLFILTGEAKSTSNVPNPAQLMDEIYNHSQKKARVYLITYTAREVAHKLDCGNNFLLSMLDFARCVYSVDDSWLHLKRYGVTRHPQITADIKRHWNTRFARAKYLHSITGTMDVTENPAANFEVLQNVLKQTCLGLLYVFWEYKPSYTSLSYLLHLCSHFFDLPAKLFHTNTFQSHFLFHELCRADQNMKYKTKTPLSLKQTDKAWKKCDIFLRKAGGLAEQRLQELEELSGKYE